MTVQIYITQLAEGPEPTPAKIIEGVFHHGRWMTLADSDRRLREQAAARDSLRRVP